MAARTPSAQAGRGTAGADTPERIDYLTFAQGAVPIAIGGAGAKLGADLGSGRPPHQLTANS